jgi:hypothetical protein
VAAEISISVYASDSDFEAFIVNAFSLGTTMGPHMADWQNFGVARKQIGWKN